MYKYLSLRISPLTRRSTAVLGFALAHLLRRSVGAVQHHGKLAEKSCKIGGFFRGTLPLPLSLFPSEFFSQPDYLVYSGFRFLESFDFGQLGLTNKLLNKMLSQTLRGSFFPCKISVNFVDRFKSYSRLKWPEVSLSNPDPH